MLATPRYSKTPLLSREKTSLYLPRVKPSMNLEAILADVGQIEHIDWVDPDDGVGSAFVHFSEWYDTPLSERILMDLDEGLSFRVPYPDQKYLIVRKNQTPLVRYSGPYTIDYLAEAVETLRTAYIYGRENVLKPKHIRFDEHGEPIVLEWYVPCSPNVVYSGTKNIHQVAAEYAWWINETLSKT
jgi:hypothetical protein